MAREVAGVTGFGNRVEAGVQALVGLGLSLKAQARVRVCLSVLVAKPGAACLLPRTVPRC